MNNRKESKGDAGGGVTKKSDGRSSPCWISDNGAVTGCKKRNDERTTARRKNPRRIHRPSVTPEVNPSLLTSYYCDPIALLEDGDYPPLAALESPSAPRDRPASSGAAERSEGEIPF